MPQPPVNPIRRVVNGVVGRPSAIVGSAEANVGIPKMSDAELSSVMGDFTRIADEARKRLERPGDSR